VSLILHAFLENFISFYLPSSLIAVSTAAVAKISVGSIKMQLPVYFFLSKAKGISVQPKITASTPCCSKYLI